MKLKIGQKFKVVDEWNEKAKMLINNEGKMDKWLGKVLTVKKYSYTSGVYLAKEDKNENEKRGWYWNECMIDWKETKKLNGVSEIMGVIKVEKITGYKTSDGRVFEEEIEAKIHEEKITIQNKIDKFVDSHYFPNMTRSDLAEILTEFYIEMD